MVATQGNALVSKVRISSATSHLGSLSAGILFRFPVANGITRRITRSSKNCPNHLVFPNRVLSTKSRVDLAGERFLVNSQTNSAWRWFAGDDSR